MPLARPLARFAGCTRFARLATLAAATLALLAPPLCAQERSLHWPRIDITARLDADGRLHVTERQVMRFSGEWNGGERRFDRRPTQRFTFEGMTRIDSLTGAPVPMREGDLDVVDGWREEGGTVRWRSRLPSDPPFDGTRLTYELGFSYGDILVVRDDGSYLLDHDFGFAARDGRIDTLAITLTVDPAWRTPVGFTGRWEATDVPPGEGFGVDVPLVRLAATPPAGVRFGAAPATRWAVLALLVAGMGAIVARLVRHDRRLGRFEPAPSPDAVTPAFLETELFAHLPEVVGAAWDGDTAQAEVAATLARLVQEQKLASRVEVKKVLVFKATELHLQLLVDRHTLRPHEQRLVQGLFGASDTTSTSAIRERYRTTGFNPASLIDSEVTSMAERAVIGTRVARPRARERWGVPFALLALAIALAAVGAVTNGAADLAVSVIGIAASVPFAIAAGIAARVWRRRATGFATPGTWLATTLLVPVIVFAVLVVRQGTGRAGTWTLLALAAWWWAVTWNTMGIARTSESPERIRWRRRLSAARDFFIMQLRQREPALSDAWYPYMLAFGLGPHVDSWFKAFGGDVARATTIGSGTSLGGGRSTSSSGGGFTGFGGGGGFSGGGGGAEFGAALGSFASSVSAPSSSSSGGSRSSSSSSSGGGGGGGW